MRLLIVAIFAFSTMVKGEQVLSEIESKISPRLYFNLLKAGQKEKLAIPHQFPHQVFYVTNKGTYCGGTIIRYDAILTAAHCVLDKTINSVQVIPGVHNISKPEVPWQIKNSVEVKVHKEYDPTTYKHDIAIVTFQNPFVFDGKIVNPISWYEGKEDFNGKEATASGWGWRHDSAKSVSNELHYFTSNVITNKECEEIYRTKVTENIVCLDQVPGEGNCHIDAGGPLHVSENNKLYQIGIFSFGNERGCSKGKPTAYTRISKYAQWIKENLPK